MPDPPSKCSMCESRPATHYLTSIIHGETTSQELCDECFQAHSSATGMRLPDITNARCDYCGGHPAGASLNQAWQQAASGTEHGFTCLSCSFIKVEETAKLNSELESAGNMPSTMEAMIDFLRALDSRVRQRVSASD